MRRTGVGNELSGNYVSAGLICYGFCNSSCSLAMFAAIRRASSRINTVRLSLAQFFGVPQVTALSAEYDHLYRRELTDESGGCRGQ